MHTMRGFLGLLSDAHRAELEHLGRPVAFAAGERIFEESARADRLWIVHSGSVALDMRVPGRQRAVIDTLGHGELLGWSWLFPPYVWHLGAVAASPVRAIEFDAAEVRELCVRDPELGRALALGAAQVIAQRLHRTRTRLLDLYGPYAPARMPL